MLCFYDPLHTGGSIVQSVLCDNYGDDNVLRLSGLTDSAARKSEKEFRSRNRRKSLKAVVGHIKVGEERAYADGEPVRRTTLLRRPAIRLYAHYRYLRSGQAAKTGSMAAVKKFKAKQSFAAFVGKIADNPYLDNPYTRIFSGENPPAGECTEAMLQAAQLCLREKFAVVGIAEKFDSSLGLMKQLLEWPNALTYPEDQAGEQAERDFAGLKAEVHTAVFNALLFDNRLYRWACAHFKLACRDHHYQLQHELGLLMSRRMHSLYQRENAAVNLAETAKK